MNSSDLSQEENSMVNSILNDLNDTGGQGQGKPVPQLHHNNRCLKLLKKKKQC